MASSDEDSHTMKDSQYNDQDSRDVSDPHPAGHGQVGDTPKNPSEIQDTVAREGTSSPPAAVLRHRSAQLVSVDCLQVGGTNNPTFFGPVYKPTLHITQYVNLRENIPERPLVDVKTTVTRKKEVDEVLTKVLETVIFSLVQTHGVQFVEEKFFEILEKYNSNLQGVKRECVTFVFRIESRKGLDELWNMYITGELAKKLSEILITDELTKEDKSDSAIQAIILESDYEQACRFFDELEKDQQKETKIIMASRSEGSHTREPHPDAAGQRHHQWQFTSVVVVLIAVACLIAKYKFYAVEDLENCQQQLMQVFKDTTGTIPSHPVLSYRTVDIDKFFANLEQIREVPGKISREETVSDTAQTVRLPLDKWEDLFQPNIVKEPKIVLSGGAGYGKTTILQKIANAWSAKGKQSKFKLVFLLKLRQMQKSGCIIDAIFDQILPKDTNLTKSKMKDIIANNQADIAFLLDGLDEIPSNILESTECVYGIKDVLQKRVLVNSYVLVKTTRPLNG